MFILTYSVTNQITQSNGRKKIKIACARSFDQWCHFLACPVLLFMITAHWRNTQSLLQRPVPTNNSMEWRAWFGRTKNFENSDDLCDLWGTKTKREKPSKNLDHSNCELDRLKLSLLLKKNSLCFASEALLFYQSIESSETEHARLVVSWTDRKSVRIRSVSYPAYFRQLIS